MPGSLRRALLAFLVVGVFTPTVTAASQGSEISFPPVGSGQWEGLVLVSGFITEEWDRSDGTFGVSVTEIVENSVNLDFTVDAEGAVTEGTVTVRLDWLAEDVGTAPVSHDPYHVVHFYQQSGTLVLSGTAERMVAAGTLNYEAYTEASGALVEGSESVESIDVEWVFRGFEASCVRVSARLVETSANAGVMGAARLPREVLSGSTRIYNEIVTQLLTWPAELEDPDQIAKAITAAEQAAKDLEIRELPEARHLLEVVQAWNALNAELAALDTCQKQIVGWVPQAQQSWLTELLRAALKTALAFDIEGNLLNVDHYMTTELVDLWDAGLQEQAIDGDLLVRFLDAFHIKLDEAVAEANVAEIIDIFAFASRFGFPNLYDEAKAALEAMA